MIGVIADDVTGATDVAAALRHLGLRTLLTFGVPTTTGPTGDSFDALVVALKSRNLESGQAVSLSLNALDWLRGVGADRYYFKYCSTFDSTAAGNIGPVTEALADELGVAIVVTTPSSPAHGRTVYVGHLFVGDALLADSHMRHHPITPMRDSSLPRLLAAQSTGEVGLLHLDTVRSGVAAVRGTIAEMRRAGVRQLVADATSNEDLKVLGQAIADMPLAAGAAGLASGIAASDAILRSSVPNTPSTTLAAPTAIFAGSCSAITLEQIEMFRRRYPDNSFWLDNDIHADAPSMAAAALDWYDELPRDSVALLYSSLPPEGLKAVQERLGIAGASTLFEAVAGTVAQGLVDRGITRLITAGGETSGAIIDALEISAVEVGDDAAAGVPWVHCRDRALSLALKSGNFGEPEFLVSIASEHEQAIANIKQEGTNV